jgi:hypothetical protein
MILMIHDLLARTAEGWLDAWMMLATSHGTLVSASLLLAKPECGHSIMTAANTHNSPHSTIAAKPALEPISWRR